MRVLVATVQRKQAIRLALLPALAVAATMAHAPEALAAPSYASTPGTDATAGITSFSSLLDSVVGTTPGTYGYQFTVTSPITLTSLGIWDDLGDGLGASYAIGIWNQDTQSQLATATVPSGTAGTLVNDFRYTSLANSLTLAAGIYRIGAYFGSNTDFVGNNDPGNPGTATPNSSITLGAAYSTAGGSLTFPNSLDSNGPGYIGPNFLIASGGGGGAASAPGPLPALGAAAAWGFSRRLRQRIRTQRSEA